VNPPNVQEVFLQPGEIEGTLIEIREQESEESLGGRKWRSQRVNSRVSGVKRKQALSESTERSEP